MLPPSHADHDVFGPLDVALDGCPETPLLSHDDIFGLHNFALDDGLKTPTAKMEDFSGMFFQHTSSRLF
jgi:hypothetical protein